MKWAWSVLVVCVVLATAASSPAGAASKPLDACELLSTTQVSSLLGGMVTARNVGTRTPVCTYRLSSPSSPGGSVPALLLTLRSGAKARTTYYDLVHGKVHLPSGAQLTARDLIPHRITVGRTHGYYFHESPSSNREAPIFTSTFVALKNGYLVDVGLKPLANYVSVGRTALGAVLTRL